MNARALLAGAALALTFGWPAGEGLWALTWSHVSDGYSPDRAAAQRLVADRRQVVDETFPRGGARILRRADCLDMIEQRGLTRDGGIVDLDLAGAIYAMRNRRDRADAEQAAAEALTILPNPVLGAVDGCVSGSLLAPICAGWVEGRMRAALAAARPKLEEGRAASAASALAIGCRALNGLGQPSR